MDSSGPCFKATLKYCDYFGKHCNVLVTYFLHNTQFLL